MEINPDSNQSEHHRVGTQHIRGDFELTDLSLRREVCGFRDRNKIRGSRRPLNVRFVYWMTHVAIGLLSVIGSLSFTVSAKVGRDSARQRASRARWRMP